MKDFDKLLTLILRKVLIVPSSTLLPFKTQALRIIKGIDSDDAVFIACALAYPDSIIWSDDKMLKKQDKVKIVNTNEIENFL